MDDSTSTYRARYELSGSDAQTKLAYDSWVALRAFLIAAGLEVGYEWELVRDDERPAHALQLLADARTALDDPGGIPEDELAPYVDEAEVMDAVYAEAASSPLLGYAIDRIDQAVAILYREGWAPTPAAAQADVD